MKRYKKPYRVKRKKSILRNGFFRFGILSSIFFGVVLYFFVFSEFFQIEKINISGQTKVSFDEVKSLAENNLENNILFLKSKSVFLVNSPKIKKAVLDSFPQIAEAKVSRDFIKGLNIVVTERVGIAKWCGGDGKCFLFDKEGVVFKELAENDNDFLKVETPDFFGEPKLGQSILSSEAAGRIAKIEAELENNPKIPLKIISLVAEDRLDARTSENWEIYFIASKDLDWQMTKLKAVLESEIPQGKRKNLEYIDLRFGNLASYKYR